MKTRLRTYTAYGIITATVWAVILIVTRIDGATPHTQNIFWLISLGWWMGWLSATIARAVYPPLKQRRLTGTTT
jgi:hypothetical protein